MGHRLPKRRTDTAKIQPKLEAARMKPVKLRVAAAIVHHQLGGAHRASMVGARYIEQLNEAAARLAGVIGIYRLQPRGHMTLLSKEELCGATFIDGGNVLRTAAGALHYPLAVRRFEAIAAIGELTDERAETG
jgi:hypothetical protein